MDLILRVAEVLPSVEFYLVGFTDEMKAIAKQKSGSNVNYLGYIQNDKLPDILSTHKVYAQFSLSEGLPNSLCEAMLCECIPVGSDVSGIPDCIGETGYVLSEKDASKAAELVKMALNADQGAGKFARSRVIKKFMTSKRRKKILDILNS